MFDIAIIGGGITGASIAYELSKYNLNVCVIEASNDVATGTTKANSGIVHAGYDPKPGTKMAKLNVLGSQMYEELAPKFNVHYNQCGSLVLAFNEEEDKHVKMLYDRGIENGVKELSILNREEILAIEPGINPLVTTALLAKTAAVVSPWEMALALMSNAVKNGVTLKLSSKVIDIKKNDNFIVTTDKEKIEAKYVINCAGVYADEIYKMVLADKSKGFNISAVKGEYYLLDKQEGTLVNRVVFQTPNELGKGVLVSKTVHGNLIVGPNSIRDVRNKDDVSNAQSSLDYVRKMSSRTSTKINFRNNIRNFSGLRAVIDGYDDFLIEESKEVKNFINFAGIKSPGLSAAPAFGIEAKNILSGLGVDFVEKDNYEYVSLPKFFKDMTIDEINNKIKENPLYGRIICRCETVSEGEIVDAIHSIIPATTIDAVKRRCNAGMGRCQGGFCQPKVLEIIKRELNLNPMDIYQDKDDSRIVLGFTKGGNANE